MGRISTNFRAYRGAVLAAAVAGAVSVSSPETASAVSLADSLTSRNSFSFENGDVKISSYDGIKYTAFEPFSSVATVTEVMAFNTFSGAPQGSTLTVQLLSEVGDYASQNQFGVTDKDGNFQAMLGGAAIAGSMGNLAISDQDELNFALKSPETLLSATDSKNADGKAHMLGLVIEKEGDVTYNFPSLDGSIAPFTFHVLAGDIILFIEDLLAGINVLNGGTSGDFDYNDAVLLVRQHDNPNEEVPEPATAVLMALVVAAYGLRRGKKESA